MTRDPAPLGPDLLARLAALSEGPAMPRVVVTPVTRNVTPSAAKGVTGFYQQNQLLTTTVTPVTPVTPSEPMQCEWEERAAILEHDGGWSRAEAECIASRLLDLRATDAGAEELAALDCHLLAGVRARGR
ncbi:hypothetical protein [Methylobacterium nodulans]|uniref:Uncharacterized protein n=1 Tax=Methylobacterium nodulans (strain LMG 21967 / CNCM I-2342 / ORS 2060) TaxID=460265 RepID=B8IY33_METNO|nr:hypothetical protein [Methylobacterium nodulans]ACL63323.1 hypothetical protein Mnod_7730 [Methylobacterium nodulans ORS 2060]